MRQGLNEDRDWPRQRHADGVQRRAVRSGAYARAESQGNVPKALGERNGAVDQRDRQALLGDQLRDLSLRCGTPVEGFR